MAGAVRACVRVRTARGMKFYLIYGDPIAATPAREWYAQARLSRGIRQSDAAGCALTCLQR